MQPEIEAVYREIASHPDNSAFRERGWRPLFAADERARVVVVGHAPGRVTQEKGIPWSDASGRRLMNWLGLSEARFRDSSIIAQLPMDFYYPGKGKSGDLPPRKGFAELWHPHLLALMPRLELFILVGAYAQRYYLGTQRQRTLTDTVRAYPRYLPRCFPIVHPSPLNIRWLSVNPWFEGEALPRLREEVRRALREP